MRKFSKDPVAISRLSPEQYRVTQQNGTEAPGTGEYLDNKEPGIYVDIVSGEPLFASSDKFEIGMRVAQLHQAHRTRQRQGAAGRHARHDSHRGALCARGQPSRARVSRRSARPRRTTLLHQFCLAAVYPSRRHGSRGLWRVPEPGRVATRSTCRTQPLWRTSSKRRQLRHSGPGCVLSARNRSSTFANFCLSALSKTRRGSG